MFSQMLKRFVTSQTKPLARKSQLERISRESKSSFLSQLASMLVSGDDFITCGILSSRLS